MQSSPETIESLKRLADSLFGQTLGEIAASLQRELPSHTLFKKGCIGQLIETYLGVPDPTFAGPDFPSLQVEVKTIPIHKKRKPKESTFVCMVRLLELSHQIWETSDVRSKLSRVLWIPIETEQNVPLSERRIDQPILWEPSQEEEAVLQSDWEALTELIVMGDIERVHAKMGRYLQIRPKALDSKVLCEAFGKEGHRIKTMPRGFYLRPSFTRQILQQKMMPSCVC